MFKTQYYKKSNLNKLNMIRRLYYSLVFHTLSLFSIKEMKCKGKFVYLTFDDGPEPEITESLLKILKKYNAKATFFCTGKNFEMYPELVELIKADGHALGNHTYSHFNGLKINSEKYINDLDKAKELINTNLFRPPWGMLSISNFFRVKKNNKIVLWSISSNDTIVNTNWEKHCKKMVKQTKHGSIILFHFSKKHANNTLLILPMYLEKINKWKYAYSSIKGENIEYKNSI